MRNFWLGVLVFVLTAAETVVATWEARADRQVGPPGSEKFARKAAWWAAVFEGLLYAGMYLVVAEHVWLAAPGVVAAGWSKHWAMKRRIAKWKSRKRRKRTTTEPPVDAAAASTSKSPSTSAPSPSPTD